MENTFEASDVHKLDVFVICGKYTFHTQQPCGDSCLVRRQEFGLSVEETIFIECRVLSFQQIQTKWPSVDQR